MTNDANLEDKYVEKIVSMGYTEEDAKDYIKSKKPKKIIIDPNLGLGEPAPDGVICNYSDMNSFMDVSKKAIGLGATIVGGCCGSNYKHIVALSNQFK